LAAKALVLAGVAYVPVCLLELFTGPQIYAHLYGYEPYRWVGAQRYVGFRPVGLLEDGNQLGMWMATSAMIAIWFWRHRLVNAIFGIPIAWISATLLVVTLLCQSGGSIVLLLCLLPFAFVRQSHLPRAAPGGNCWLHQPPPSQYHIAKIPRRTQPSCIRKRTLLATD